MESLNTVSGIVENYENEAKDHPPCLFSPKPQPRLKLVSRPSYYGATGLPTISELDLDMTGLGLESDEVFLDVLPSPSHEHKSINLEPEAHM